MEPHETEKPCKAKDTDDRTKAANRVRKVFTSSTSDRGLISKIYKELKKLDIKKPNLKMGYISKLRILNRGKSND